MLSYHIVQIIPRSKESAPANELADKCTGVFSAHSCPALCYGIFLIAISIQAFS